MSNVLERVVYGQATIYIPEGMYTITELREMVKFLELNNERSRELAESLEKYVKQEEKK